MFGMSRQVNGPPGELCFVEGAPVDQTTQVAAGVKTGGQFDQQGDLPEIVLLHHHAQGQGKGLFDQVSEVVEELCKGPARPIDGIGRGRGGIHGDLRFLDPVMQAGQPLPALPGPELAVAVQTEFGNVPCVGIELFQDRQVGRTGKGIAIAAHGDFLGLGEKLCANDFTDPLRFVAGAPGGDLSLGAAARAGQVAAVIKTEIEPGRRKIKVRSFFFQRNFDPLFSDCGKGLDRTCGAGQKRAAGLTAIVETAVMDGFANFLRHRAVPDAGHRRAEQVADGALQPGRAAEENIALLMDFKPGEGAGADYLRV